LQKAAYAVHVCGTALDDVSGLAAHMPFKVEFLNMRVKAVPQFPRDCLAELYTDKTAEYSKNA
jgi:hypothetical protein